MIPCYNEAKNIPLLLEKCSKFSEHDAEVILVDNGSSDNTNQVLKDNILNYPACRSIKLDKNDGYGGGILAGLKVAKGEIIGWTHADLQTDPIDALKALEFFQDSADGIFVKGKRYGRPVFDVFFTICMSIFESVLLKKYMWDINAQPTVFPRNFFNEWSDPPKDFSLDLYAYYLAKNKKFTLYRFPVLFSSRAFGTSSWNIGLKSKIIFIKRTISYSFNLKKSLSK